MTWPQAIIVYVMCWWLVFFMALPFGSRPPENSLPGMTRAAPQKTYLAVKCLATTLLAGLATWGIDFFIHSGIVAVR